MGIPRTLWRVLRLGGHILTGALICVWISLATRAGHPPAWAPAVVRWWHGGLCRALGVRIRVSGAVAERSLLVANHISWLDVPVLGAQGPLGFLSKAEVRGWPLVGWMSAVAGTLFIERGANQASTVSIQITGAIAEGRTLVVFPEGTTSDGRQVRRFHPRLFAVAQHPGFRLQPVAIGYRHGSEPGPDPQVPYVGEDTLAANLWRIVRHPDLVAEVRFLAPMEPQDGEDRRRFAARARLGIVQALGLPADAHRETALPLGVADLQLGLPPSLTAAAGPTAPLAAVSPGAQGV